jgi:hypothetical protein
MRKRSHSRRGAAAFVEGPDHQALPAPGVAGRENARMLVAYFSCSALTLVRASRSTPVVRAAAVPARGSPWPASTNCAGAPFPCRHFRGGELALFVALPFDLHGVDFLDVALLVAGEFLGGGQIDARVAAEFGGGFLLAVIQLVNLRPFRPRIVLGALQRRRGRISNCTRLLQPWRIEVPTQSVPVSPPPMTMTSLPSAEMKAPFLMAVEQALGVGVQKFHGEMNAFELRGLRWADRAAWSRRCTARRRQIRAADFPPDNSCRLRCW